MYIFLNTMIKIEKKIKLPHEYKMYLEQVLNILRSPLISAIEEPLTTKRMLYLEFK